jgi:hypothetical protein
MRMGVCLLTGESVAARESERERGEVEEFNLIIKH